MLVSWIGAGISCFATGRCHPSSCTVQWRCRDCHSADICLVWIVYTIVEIMLFVHFYHGYRVTCAHICDVDIETISCQGKVNILYNFIWLFSLEILSRSKLFD